MTDVALLTLTDPLRRLAAASTPDPSPSGGIVGQTGEKLFDFWEWFTGWPLQVIIVLVVGVVALAVVRRVIAHVTDRIAKGYHRAYVEATEEDEPTTTGRKARKVLVEDTLGLATPEVKQRRARRARTVGSVLTSAATIIIITAMALFVLGAVGAGNVVAGLLGTAGVVGVAVGFGAQSLVRDFLSGLFILLEDQYGVGDVVDLGAGAIGTVEKVDLRLTHVRSFDGTLWHVRNGEILRAGNRTQQWARAVAEVRVPVGSDVDVVRAALGRAVDVVQSDEVLGADLLETPAVRGVDAITEGAYAFTMHAKVRPGRDGDVMRALLVAAYAQLRAAGIIVTGAASSA
ncbi:mechanosensitive ion channel family protein [Xylanimonas protaetiae]|uniref:Mechanosensitive ion channel family protein n=1 Tax=Xylanimonas protaetiae TaxID=2509457 RepID=A0A4P6F4G9_9MICO|nr:mechanosensitive ion channel family protein [Xylanimonas protaetiae]QAY70464.1 mechanosensitive ion channel family protein [Xylanimonas protaetiae]